MELAVAVNLRARKGSRIHAAVFFDGRCVQRFEHHLDACRFANELNELAKAGA